MLNALSSGLIPKVDAAGVSHRGPGIHTASGSPAHALSLSETTAGSDKGLCRVCGDLTNGPDPHRCQL